MLLPLPEVPPLKPADIVGTDQLYCVFAGTTPLVPFTGLTVNVPLPHIELVMVVMAGFGVTLTVTKNKLPEQLPNEGVTA